MSDLKELIKYIEVLEVEPFTGWTGGNKIRYLTACTSIKKKAEKLLQEQANGANASDSGLHLQRVMAMLPDPMEQNQAALDYAEQRNNPDFFLVKQVYKDGINYITNLLTKKLRGNQP